MNRDPKPENVRDAIDVKCPLCGARRGNRCVVVGAGWQRTYPDGKGRSAPFFHMARRRLAWPGL